MLKSLIVYCKTNRAAYKIDDKIDLSEKTILIKNKDQTVEEINYLYIRSYCSQKEMWVVYGERKAQNYDFISKMRQKVLRIEHFVDIFE